MSFLDNYEDLYSSVNKNALSDGDEKGEGENNGAIGSKTDKYTSHKGLFLKLQKRVANTLGYDPKEL